MSTIWTLTCRRDGACLIKWSTWPHSEIISPLKKRSLLERDQATAIAMFMKCLFLYYAYPYQPIWNIAQQVLFWGGGLEYRILCIPMLFIRKIPMFMKRHFYTAHTNSYQCEWVHTLHTKAFDAYFAYHPYLYNASTFCLYEADHVYEVSFLIQCIPIPTSMKHCTFGFLCCVCGGGGAYRILCIPCQFSRKLPMFVKRHFYTAHTNSYQCEWVHTLHTKAYDAYFAYHAYQSSCSTFCL